ncbi:unnamed protein product [Mytilus edulis]|uniref:Ig-like domain-containing protein n=1 Tax=Mytilus edulis TaxID=6550 RepID=A0A8S3TS98_MYTED|nr:unnamed protein product [Mytilus edulis]
MCNVPRIVKPVIVPFVSNTLSTDENKLFNTLCQTVGSRPAASMHWLLGQQNITSNSTSQSNEQSSTDKYTVTSNLRYRVDRRYNGQMLTCRGSNVAGYTETSLTLNVKCKCNCIYSACKVCIVCANIYQLCSNNNRSYYKQIKSESTKKIVQ